MKGSRRLSSRHQSAVTQHAVHPPAEGRPRRQSASGATLTRQQVQPPVCGVQPGRALELRTNLGLARAKQLLQQQSIATEQPTEPGHNSSSNIRAQLKSARLQPLGIVEDESTTSQLCLGIIPARDTAQQTGRPRSSTTPGVHSRTSSQTDSPKRTTKARQRTQSAILGRFDRQHLMKLPKQTGFLPLDNPHKFPMPNEPPTQSEPNSLTLATDQEEDTKHLPPVVQHGEHGMRVEFKGLRQPYEPYQSKDSSKVSPTRKNNLPPIAKTPTQSPRQTIQITSITQSPRLATNTTTKTQSPRGQTTNAQTKATTPKQTAKDSTEHSIANQSLHSKDELLQRSSETQRTGHPTDTNAPGTNESNRAGYSPMHISIVTVAEGRAVGEPTRTRQRRRTSSGRLSLGWSPPQTVEPLTGSAVSRAGRLSNSPCPKGESEKKGMDPEPTEGRVSSDKYMNPSNSMLIEVNVNDFLEDS